MGYTELVTDCRWCRAHGSLEGSNQEVEQRLPGQALPTFVPGVNGPRQSLAQIHILGEAIVFIQLRAHSCTWGSLGWAEGSGSPVPQ